MSTRVWVPRTHVNVRMQSHTSITPTLSKEGKDKWIPGVADQSVLAKQWAQVYWEAMFKKIRRGSDRGRHPNRLTSGLHMLTMCTHICVHTHPREDESVGKAIDIQVSEPESRTHIRLDLRAPLSGWEANTKESLTCVGQLAWRIESCEHQEP